MTDEGPLDDYAQRNLPEILEVVRAHAALVAEFAARGRDLGDVDRVVRSWAQPGYSAEGVSMWMAVRCADPVTAGICQAISLSLEQAGEITDLGDGPPDTVAFKLALGQISPKDALAVAGVATLLVDDERALGFAERSDEASQVARNLANLEVLRDVLDGALLPSAANEVTYELVRAIGRTGNCLQKLGERTFLGLAEYLSWQDSNGQQVPLAPGEEAEGARELAGRLMAFGREVEALTLRARSLFFGSKEFNPSGWAIRIAMNDGTSWHTRVEQLERGRDRDDR